jgi:hypothetical protein
MKKPKVNIDFAINTRGQLVQYFVNPLNASYGYIIDGVKQHNNYRNPRYRIIAEYLFSDNADSFKFTHLENTPK